MKNKVLSILVTILLISTVTSSVYSYINDKSVVTEAKAIAAAKAALAANIKEPVDFESLHYTAVNNDGTWRVEGQVQDGTYYAYIQVLDGKMTGVGYSQNR